MRPAHPKVNKVVIDMSDDQKPLGVSIFIQTLDEEANIADCIACFGWCDDIVVLDSFSCDKTEEIAKSMGARWIQHKYEGRAAHQNWAMDNIDFKYRWVYYTDADERVPPELAAEIHRVTTDPTTAHVAFQVARRDHFQDSWIKRSTSYPLWIVRLFQPGTIRWTRKANPVPEIDGTVGRLENDYLHYPFSKGLADWIWRHNRYSSFEAEETLHSLAFDRLRLAEVLSFDAILRRNALKRLSLRLPARPVFKFIYFYFFRLGLLDGLPGLRYCLLQSIYEYFIVLKVTELRAEKADSK
jgi:glycosyltransferase involved in cell wall biosynthesis